jgi:hypothetical protein
MNSDTKINRGNFILIILVSAYTIITNEWGEKKCPSKENLIFKFLCGEKIPINCQREEVFDMLKILFKESQAQKIYEYISSIQIDDIKELEKIKGIGPKTTAKINQFFIVERNCSE